MSEEELALVIKYVKIATGDIIELGTFRGGTTEEIAACLDSENFIWSFDLYSDLALKHIVDYNPTVIKERYLSDYNNVFLVIGDAVNAGNGWRSDIGLLIIDHAHDYSSTLKAFLSWEDVIGNQGFIIFHDYIIKEPGVIQCVDEILVTGQWEMVELVETLIVIQRQR